MAKAAKIPAASTDDLLRELMAASGLTDYAIAKLAGVTPSQIGRFKRKERSITTETADKLFRGLGYDWPPPTEVLPATQGVPGESAEEPEPAPAKKAGKPRGDKK